MAVSSHPDFGVQRLRARLRWLSRAHFAHAFGEALASPLRELPVLSVERRSLLRDPNEEEWALQEEGEAAVPSTRVPGP